MIKKYISTIGLLFNDIFIVRDNGDQSEDQILKIPLTYSVKEKVQARFIQDPNLDKPFSVNLPMISFQLNGMQYDRERKLNSIDRLYNKIDKSNVITQYNPTPWNFLFKVSIWVKNQEDGTKIVEQILPAFKPDIVLSADLIPNLGIVFDLPVLLLNIQKIDQYEGSFEDRQYIVYDLDLVLKGYLFGPQSTFGVIRYVDVKMYIPDTNTAQEAVNTITVPNVEIIVVPEMIAGNTITTDGLNIFNTQIPSSDMQETFITKIIEANN